MITTLKRQKFDAAKKGRQLLGLAGAPAGVTKREAKTRLHLENDYQWDLALKEAKKSGVYCAERGINALYRVRKKENR